MKSMDFEVTKKINILQMVNGLAIGGGELKLLELVQHLSKDKYNITICSVGQGGPLKDNFESLGFKVYVLEKKHKYDFSQVLKVAKLMKKEKIDLVQTTLFYADVIGAYAAKLAKVPIVISWEAVTQPYKYKHLLAYNLAARKINVIVAVSNAIRRQVINERKVKADNVITIRYGVDLNKFSIKSSSNGVKRSDIGVDKDDIVLGTVARFTEQKGHAYLIDAAVRIINSFPSAKFVFVGDGPLRGDLEYQIDKLGIKEHFKLLGFRNDIKELLNIFDIFILPSLYEGLPNVVLEAMACYKPVIATAVDGTVEAVVDDVTGLLVPPKNAEILTRKVCYLLKNKHRIAAMGKAGRKRVEHIFTLQKQVREFEELYDQQIKKKGS